MEKKKILLTFLKTTHSHVWKSPVFFRLGTDSFLLRVVNECGAALLILLHLLTQGLQLQYRGRPSLLGPEEDGYALTELFLATQLLCEARLMAPVVGQGWGAGWSPSWCSCDVSAAGPVSVGGSVLEPAHGSLPQGAELFVKWGHLKLCHKLCALHWGFSFWGEEPVTSGEHSRAGASWQCCRMVISLPDSCPRARICFFLPSWCLGFIPLLISLPSMIMLLLCSC